MPEFYIQAIENVEMSVVFYLYRTQCCDEDVLEGKPESLQIPPNLLAWVKHGNKKNLNTKEGDTLLLEKDDLFNIGLSSGNGAIVVNDLFTFLETQNSAPKIPCDPFDLKPTTECDEKIRIIGKGRVHHPDHCLGLEA